MSLRRPRAARLRVFAVVLALGTTLATAARAAKHAKPKPDASAKTETTADVETRPIDLATVRVFGIDGVAEQQVEGKKSGKKRLVAVVDGGHGSGVVVDDSGTVLTAKHVVEHAEILAVKVPGDDRIYAARTIYMDPDHDIAFLALDAHPAHFLRLPEHPKSLHAGQHVSASGYPLDPNQSTPALSSGQVSRKNENGMYELDMSVNPGNSGGPVTDDKGNVVGIVVQGADPTAGAQGFALAEPIRLILTAYASGLTSAARSQSFDESDAAVAAAAFELARTGPLGIADDETVHDKLVAVGPSKRPAVLALMAGHTWDILMGMLEDRNVDTADDLTAEADRKNATQLLADCIRLSRAAVAIDPTLPDRSGFVKDMLAAAAEWSRAASQTTTTSAEVTQPDRVVDSAPFKRPRIDIDLMAAGTPDSVAGGLAVVGDVVRVAGDHVALSVGGEGTVGQWRSTMAGMAAVDVGLRASVGKKVGVVGGVFYTPGYVVAEGRSMFTYRAYRAEVGMYVRGVSFGATWQQANRGADATFQTVGGYFGIGF